MTKITHRTSLGSYIGQILFGFIFWSVFVVILESKENENLILVVLLLALLLIILIFNVGNYITIKDDVITRYQLYKPKESIELKNFNFVSNGSELVFTDLNTKDIVNMKAGFIGNFKLKHLIQVLKPLSQNGGVKEIEVL